MDASYQPKYLARMVCDSVSCLTWTIHLISSGRDMVRCVLCGLTKVLRGDSSASIGKED